MFDVFFIEGVYCTDDQCDVYKGEVSFDNMTSGPFSLASESGKEATIKLDVFTFNIDIAINDQNGEAIKRELRDLEVITKDDGSWYINKDIGSDKFEITIMPS